MSAVPLKECRIFAEEIVIKKSQRLENLIRTDRMIHKNLGMQDTQK